MRRPWVVALLVPWAIAVSTTPADAGPITFNTALPVHTDEKIVREQVIWLRSTDDPSGMDRELNVIMVPSVLMYGVSPRLALFGILPFLYKDVRVATPMGRVDRSTSGFGDLTAMARLTAFIVDRKGETIRIAPFVGLELPTGADDEADALGRFPQPFQLGSGSWDPLGGVIFTWQTLRFEVDVSASYQLRTKANDFDAGDDVRAEASFQYRVVPWGQLGAGVPNYLFGVLELNAVWQGMDRIGDVSDRDSGGFTTYLAPGLQWVSLRTIVEAAVQIPVVQDSNGDALRNDFVVWLSVRRSF